MKALLTESSRLAEESSLLVMNLLVQLETGTLANIKTQRIGYMFPDQRCACCSGDLVLRRYSQVRDQGLFSYQHIQKVYTIVLLYPEFGEIYYQVFQFRRNIEVFCFCQRKAHTLGSYGEAPD